MYKIIFIAFLSIVTIEIYGQNFIEGKIVDTNSNSIEFVTIVLLKDSIQITGTISNRKGIFNLPNVPLGNYQLRLSLIGFKTTILEIDTGNSSNIGTIILEKDEYELDEVVITGNKTQLKSEVNKTVFDVPNSIKQKSTDIFQVLQHIPELTVDIVTRNIQVNGESNILILVNGVQRNLSYASSISPNEILKIELIHSPSGKYIAQDISGVINIVKKNEVSGYSGYISSTQTPKLNYGLSNGSFKIIYKKLSFYFDAQNFFFDELKHKSSRETTIDTNEDVFFYSRYSNYYPFKYSSNSINGGIDYNISEKSFAMINFSSNINSYDMSLNINSLNYHNNILIKEFQVFQENESKTNNNIVSIYYEFNNKKNERKFTFMADYNSFHSTYSNAFTETYNNDTSVNSHFFENNKEIINVYLDYEFNFKNIVDIEVGTRLSNPTTTFLSLYENTNSNTFIHNELRNSTYINFLGGISKNNKLFYQIGSFLDGSKIRINDTIHNNYMFYLPYVDIQYKINNKNSFKVGYSVTRETPSIAALNPYIRYNDSTKLVSGNPYLSPYYVNGFILNYTYSKGFIYISPSFSYRFTDDFITTTGSVNEDGIYFMTYSKTANYQNVFGKISTTLNIKKWGRVKGEFKLDHKQYNSYNILSTGMLLQTSFFLKNYYLQLSFNKEPDELQANSRYIKPIETMAYFQWKISNSFSMNSGLRYLIPWKEAFKTNDIGYSEHYSKNIQERRFLVFIGFRYNFTKGIKFKSNEVRVYEQENDAQMKERL